MKAALIGYGKMGHIIESVLLEKGHSVSFRINEENKSEIHDIRPDNTDVCIEFTGPEAAFDNLTHLIRQGLPVVCGTTGWYARMPEIYELVKKQGTSFVAASNFSIGVNLFFEAARQLAALMKHRDYSVKISETHHIHKKDAPSGTAITLSEQVRAVLDEFEGYQLNSEKEENLIPIYSHRLEDVPGTHELTFGNEIDEISLKHVAFNRNGFALGAVLAAEYIIGRKGIFTIGEILKHTMES